MIGADISVTVVAINGGQVRLGVKAPKNVPVHREEVLGGIPRERKSHEEQSP